GACDSSEGRRNVPIDAATCGEPKVPAVRPPAEADPAFSDFFQAGSSQDAAAAADRIVASGIGFDEAFGRLKRGRVYSRDVPRGTVQGSYRSGTTEYFYALDVPESYDPARAYQVRVQLHGGVARIDASAPRPGSTGRLPA